MLPINDYNYITFSKINNSIKSLKKYLKLPTQAKLPRLYLCVGTYYQCGKSVLTSTPMHTCYFESKRYLNSTVNKVVALVIL